MRRPMPLGIAISMVFMSAVSLTGALDAPRDMSLANATPRLDAAAGCTIVGTARDERLRGTTGRDVICGKSGNDILLGLAGDDVIRGGRGRDVIVGGPGRDLVKGDAGNDRARGNDGDDALRGGAGRDVLGGGRGDDGLRGGAAGDDLTGAGGSDRLRGNAGDDDIDALDERDRDTVIGQDGSDSCLADFGDSVESCERGGTAPPAPSGLDGTATSSRVDLTWTGSPGATGYTVYRDGSALATVSGPSYDDTAVESATSYSYRVDAFNDVGSSPRSPGLQIDTPPGPEGSKIVMAAGDIACDPGDGSFRNGNGTSTRCRQGRTADLLSGADAILSLGDQQYECGGLNAFRQSYDPSWGRFLAITHPILADEEYGIRGTDCGNPGADGYFAYFADRLASHGPSASDPDRGYYSFDIGAWHVVALNSECSRIPGGCEQGGAQNDWLERDLAASSARCTIALTHEPRFASKSSGAGAKASLRSFWNDLYDHGVEMVLSGDSHWYERFAPQDPEGAADPAGVVQWIVGTGGKSHGGLAPESDRRPNSVTAVASSFGVLRLELRDDGYSWNFKVEGSSSYSDAGSGSCH